MANFQQFHALNKKQPPQVAALDLPPNMSTVLLKKQTISVEPRPLPILQPDGVLVRVIASGICGSDMHNFTAGGVGGRPIPVDDPLVMGHESAGEVLAVGDLVTTHKVGDRVASESPRVSERASAVSSAAFTTCQLPFMDLGYWHLRDIANTQSSPASPAAAAPTARPGA